jgi:acyl-coenzyme A synthetase/AMP-(fatty) acid ligase
MITNRIYEWARTQPAKTAMIHGDRLYSYAVFARAIEATKNFFENQNLPAGLTAIICVNNLADAWIVMLGLRSIGLDTICVDSLAAAKALNIKDVGCIVVTEAERAGHKIEEQFWPGASAIEVPRAIYANINTGDIPRPSNAPRPFGGHILYTSGTTGTYKKVLWEGAIEDRRNERRSHFPPFNSFHVNTIHHGVNFGLWTAAGVLSAAVWHVGGSVVIDQRPEKFREFFRHGINMASLVPTLLREILAHRDPSSPPIPGVELLLSGGFVPLRLVEETIRQLGGEVSIGYGSTECLLTAVSRFRTVEDLFWLTPCADRVVEIVNEQGEALGPDQPGELRVHLIDCDSRFYVGDEEASRRFFRDSCFYPGDMAVRRSDGRIRILGRTTDVLNIQGKKVSVAPLEQEVQQRLGVESVCIFGGLDDDGREQLVIAIEAARIPPRASLEAAAAGFRMFERVQFKVLQQFPRTEAGMQKIRRAELRQLVFGKKGD